MIPRLFAVALAAGLAAAPLLALDPATAPTVADTIEKAKSAKQDIVLFFYGPDWDSRGAALNQGAWAQAKRSLGAWTATAIPIFDLDDTAEKKQLTEKNKPFKFKIWNYPAVAYCDTEGDVVAVQEGLPATATAAYFSQFAQNGKKLRERRDTFFKQAEKAEGVEKARLLGQGLTVLPMAIARTYKREIDQISKLDPDNKTGYPNVLRFSYTGVIEPVIKEKIKAGTDAFKTQEDRLNDMLKNPVRPKSQQQVILAAKYALYNRAELYDKADATLQELIRIDPKSDYAMGAKTILDKQISRPKK